MGIVRVGGVRLEDGKIIDLVIGILDEPPLFDAVNIGNFTFSLSDKVLRFNTGENLVALNTSITENPNLKSSLGSNWLNDDLSFNPVPFNNLPNIIGLDSTDSLFNVIEQITDLIDNINNVTLEDINLEDIITPDMSILAYLSGDLIFVSIEQVLEGSIISLDFDNLEGFNITDTTTGNMIIFQNEELISKKVHFRYENLSTNVGHLVTHNLNSEYCSVFCINPATKLSIVPSSIEFVSTNELLINLSSAQPLIALVTNFNV
jgi:hypothetical protein